MTITFITNLIHHHQVHVADEMYAAVGEDYHYVATEALPDWLKKGGYQETERPYLIKAYQSDAENLHAMRLALESDVVIIGSAPDCYVRERMRRNKLTFRYAERWFKDGYYHLLSPRALKGYYETHTRWRHHNVYMLCASAYTPNDAAVVCSYPGKCLKWGYFTAVPEFDIDAALRAKRASTLKILWVSRFLEWKHPERMLQLASLLRCAGYDDFVIDMVGSGELFEKTKAQVAEQGLERHVRLLGNFPNDQIHPLMREHHIFCFTSDRNEGWGAVLNESMSNGCAVVASHAIGSVPFLVRNGENGLIYNSDSPQDLFGKVRLLIDHPDQREALSLAAYRTMHDVWSPKNATANFLRLAQSMLQGSPIEITEGPCSKAVRTKKNFYNK